MSYIPSLTLSSLSPLSPSPSPSLPLSPSPPLPIQLTQVQVKLRQSETQSEMLTQQLHATRRMLEAREAEITLLSREREFWPVSTLTPPCWDRQLYD